MISNLSPLSFYDDVMVEKKGKEKKGREYFTAHKLKCYSQMTVVGWKAPLKGEKKRAENKLEWTFFANKVGILLSMPFYAIDHFYDSQMGFYCLEYSIEAKKYQKLKATSADQSSYPLRPLSYRAFILS